MGVEHLLAAVIEQAKSDYIRSVPGGDLEKLIEKDIRSRYFCMVILNGIADPEEVITEWQRQKRQWLEMTKNSQF